MNKNPHLYLKDPKHIEAVESIERVDEEGYLYHMDVDYDYYDLPEAFMARFDAGCSAFVTRNLEGDILFCRNYDYSHYKYNDWKNNPRTGLNMIMEGKSPKAKYKTFAVADTFWIDFENGSYSNGMADDGITDTSAFLMSPFLSMDGMNEAGLAMGILALSLPIDWQEIDYDTYKEKLDEKKHNFFYDKSGEVPAPFIYYAGHGSVVVNEADKKAWIAVQDRLRTDKEGLPVYPHTIPMRMALDNCATIEEAIAVFNNVNVASFVNGADYHVLIADKSGKSVLLEWQGNDLQVVEIDHATNHYVSKEDPCFKDGCGRDEVLKAGLFRARENGMREDFAEKLLGLVIQDPTNGMDRGKTQYTCIYNLTKKTIRVFSYGDLSKHWDYSIQ